VVGFSFNFLDVVKKKEEGRENWQRMRGNDK
jgi:hypothetical protein